MSSPSVSKDNGPRQKCQFTVLGQRRLYLTKALADLVSRKGLLKLPENIGCPQKLQNVISSCHEDMKGTVLLGGSSSAPMSISTYIIYITGYTSMKPAIIRGGKSYSMYFAEST